MSKYRLGDIASIQAGPFGTQLHKNEYVSFGIPMLNSKNIGNGNVLNESIDYVPQSVLDRLPQYVLMEGDILFGRAGTIERHAYVTKKYAESFQGTNCIRIRCRNKRYALYISYYLWLDQLKKAIENNAGGSIQAYITTDLLKEITINIPDNYEEIAYILSIIDAKIANNNNINDNLQQMSIATYMHLFYGKKSNGKLGDILIENPKSTIQVGEAKDKLGDFPFFTSGDAVFRWTEPIVEGRNIFLNTGGNAGVKFYVGKTAYSTDAWCITAKYGMEDYLYLLLDSIKQELNLKFFQGTGLKHLQKPLLKDRAIYIPSKEEISNFNADIKPWLSMLSDKTRESFRLSALRNWLLPMLMNGQVSIIDEQEEQPQINNSGFEKWLTNQGFAARGDVDMEVLRNIYEAMDSDDK